MHFQPTTYINNRHIVSFGGRRWTGGREFYEPCVSVGMSRLLLTRIRCCGASLWRACANAPLCPNRSKIRTGGETLFDIAQNLRKVSSYRQMTDFPINTLGWPDRTESGALAHALQSGCALTSSGFAAGGTTSSVDTERPGLVQRLVQIGDDVADVLEADGMRMKEFRKFLNSI